MGETNGLSDVRKPLGHGRDGFPRKNYYTNS